MSTLNFDARTVAPQEAFEPLPAGWYNVKIVESETKPTSDGQGAFLALTLQVIDGQYVNRKVFDRLNLQNKNPVAQEIAYKTLSAICHATGVIQVQDSQQLHGIPIMAKVSLRAAGPGADGKQYDASNDVKGYKRIEAPGQQTNFSAPAPGFAAPPQQGAPTGWSPPQQPTTPPPLPPQQQTAPTGWSPPQQQPPPLQPPAPTQQPTQTGTAPVPPWAQPAPR